MLLGCLCSCRFFQSFKFDSLTLRPVHMLLESTQSYYTLTWTRVLVAGDGLRPLPLALLPPALRSGIVARSDPVQVPAAAGGAARARVWPRAPGAIHGGYWERRTRKCKSIYTRATSWIFSMKCQGVVTVPNIEGLACVGAIKMYFPKKKRGCSPQVKCWVLKVKRLAFFCSMLFAYPASSGRAPSSSACRWTALSFPSSGGPWGRTARRRRARCPRRGWSGRWRGGCRRGRGGAGRSRRSYCCGRFQNNFFFKKKGFFFVLGVLPLL